MTPLSLLPLPVSIAVGSCTVVAGTVNIDPDKPVGPQMADFLVEVAAACRALPTEAHNTASDQEVSTDAAS